MRTLVAGIIFIAVGLAVVVDELTGLSFGQTSSLAGLVGALAVLAAAVLRARAGARDGNGGGAGADVPITDTADGARSDPGPGPASAPDGSST
ncbi:MAG: hypothetical protein AAFN30_00600 [Actinomycetota bacterium]